MVPIEIGSMLSKDGMVEKMMNVRSFVSDYLAPSSTHPIWSLEDAVSLPSAYLAQHAVLDQIPKLLQDVEAAPSLCGSQGPTKINVWMGTGGTRTPLHYDSYDNLLVQIVGAKYVRIYGKEETPKLYVTKKGAYALQGNMSAVDCEREDFDLHPLARDAAYQEVLLMPGDCLFIPSRVWHYVRSLSTSVSVNYWW
jgi:lysine-specific demethylase 8